MAFLNSQNKRISSLLCAPDRDNARRRKMRVADEIGCDFVIDFIR